MASSPCAASASSYHFSSSASPRWRSAFSQFAPVVKLGFPVLASGSNCAVKPTRLRRAAYFRSLACLNPGLHSQCFCTPPTPVQALLRWGAVAVAGFAFRRCGEFWAFWALALMHRAQVALFSVAQCLTLRSSGPAFCGPLTLPVRNSNEATQMHFDERG
ncbi:DUF1010 domain-containing protein [Acidovorax sp. JG5]|uniref:DUF1010 domain-containing protein n=1 Tax=Acidovorax sp. JG5 TaxID=2822718 RepID=UPI001FF09E63|nr:DUF1010 domain-containing protein [Acidovorax sp. JG5]